MEKILYFICTHRHLLWKCVCEQFSQCKGKWIKLISNVTLQCEENLEQKWKEFSLGRGKIFGFIDIEV